MGSDQRPVLPRPQTGAALLKVAGTAPPSRDIAASSRQATGARTGTGPRGVSVS